MIIGPTWEELSECRIHCKYLLFLRRLPTLLRPWAWERRLRWESSSMSLELNRKSSTCKYFSTICSFWWNQIFTNLTKEPELRDLSHKHKSMQIPCFEDSQKITKAVNLTQLISFVCEVCNIFHSSAKTRWRKLNIKTIWDFTFDVSRQIQNLVDDLRAAFPTFAHSNLIQEKSPQTWKSTYIYAHVQNSHSERGIFKSEIQEWKSLAHVCEMRVCTIAVRIFCQN